MNRRLSLQNVKLPPDLLKEIATERMGKLDEDEGAFLEFLDGLDLEDVKSAQTKRQDTSDEVLQKAVINCDKEPAFEERKTRLRSKILQMTDLKNEHNKRFEELKALTTKGDHEVVLKDLQKKLRDTEKNSEGLADSYVAGTSEMSCDTFLADFQEQRTLYWLRKVKAEKMEELLKKNRPVPSPRSPRTPRQPVIPPYIAPMPGTHHAQSLPTSSLQTPYPPGPPVMSNPSRSIPPDSRRMSNPAQSMPPYHPRLPQMPMPQPPGPPQGHPFPAAAFSGYHPHPPGMPTPYPPGGAAHHTPYGGYPASTYR